MIQPGSPVCGLEVWPSLFLNSRDIQVAMKMFAAILDVSCYKPSSVPWNDTQTLSGYLEVDQIRLDLVD